MAKRHIENVRDWFYVTRPIETRKSKSFDAVYEALKHSGRLSRRFTGRCQQFVDSGTNTEQTAKSSHGWVPRAPLKEDLSGDVSVITSLDADKRGPLMKFFQLLNELQGGYG